MTADHRTALGLLAGTFVGDSAWREEQVDTRLGSVPTTWNQLATMVIEYEPEEETGSVISGVAITDSELTDELDLGIEVTTDDVEFIPVPEDPREMQSGEGQLALLCPESLEPMARRL